MFVHADPPRVFDVILEGELLRASLGESLLASGVSTERAVLLEYTLLSVPPTLTHSAPQKDWYAHLAPVCSCLAAFPLSTMLALNIGPR